MNFSIIIIVIFSISFLGCGKNCKDATYQFKMEESFLPEKDSISIGDTLFLNCSHATTFTDIMSNAQVDFSNSQIGSNVEIINFPDSSSEALGAVDDFKILKISGTETINNNIPTQNKGFYFEERNNIYLLKIGFIAKRKGDYAISLANSIGVVQRQGSCEKASIEIVNSNLNNHLYIYQNFRPAYQISEYEKTHIYCFKVY